MKESFAKDLLARLSSRKFLLAVVGLVSVFFVELTPDQMLAITALIVAFTAAEGAADLASRINDH